MARRRVAWIGEKVETGGGDPCDEWCTATFFGHVEAGDGEEPGASREFDDLQCALEWATQEADLARVRLGDDLTEYWYGATAPPRSEGLVALDRFDVVRRRPPGRAWCDRSPDDPGIEWPITVTILTGDEAPSRRLKARVREALMNPQAQAHGPRRLGRVEGTAGSPYETAIVRLHMRVKAADRASAAILAERLSLECVADAAPGDAPRARAEVWVHAPNLSEDEGGPDRSTRRRYPAPPV